MFVCARLYARAYIASYSSTSLHKASSSPVTSAALIANKRCCFLVISSICKFVCAMLIFCFTAQRYCFFLTLICPRINIIRKIIFRITIIIYRLQTPLIIVRKLTYRQKRANQKDSLLGNNLINFLFFA